MKDVWTALSLSQPAHLPGHVAYAKKKANMYAKMEDDCKKKFDAMGYHDLRLNGEALADYVAAKRAEELVSFTKPLVIN
jgi:hypothetical protein